MTHDPLATERALTALLDVNVLVALFDPGHVHHDIAHDWFADHRENGWATCAITEHGLVRVLCNPACGRRAHTVVKALQKFKASGHHVFWDATVSLTDERLFNLSLVRGHSQLTDVYLLGLAHHMKGCLATLDRGIPRSAVTPAREVSLQVIAPAD
jgi:toxin-antitoxin system PIN domain toxin